MLTEKEMFELMGNIKEKYENEIRITSKQDALKTLALVENDIIRLRDYFENMDDLTCFKICRLIMHYIDGIADIL